MENYSLILRLVGYLTAILLYIYGIRKKNIPIKFIFLLPIDKEQIHLFLRCYEIPTLILTTATLICYLYAGHWLIDPEEDWILTLSIALFMEISEYLLAINIFQKEELQERGIKL